MFGVMLFGTLIYGIPVLELEMAIWVDVCKENTPWVDAVAGASAFVDVPAQPTSWFEVPNKKVQHVRCDDAT